MMKKNSLKLLAVLGLMFAQTTVQAGNLFNVTPSGDPANISITLCLNALAQISCQNYDVSSLSLAINTVVSNHLYPNAGIRVNTPGYSALSGCSPLNNNFCAFQVSNTSPANIIIGFTTNLYGVTGFSGASTITLFSIDTTTAFPTLVMPLNSVSDGSIIASSGPTLYHFTGGLFESINLSSLSTTTIPMSGPSFNEPYGAVFFNSANAFLIQKRSDEEFMKITTSGVRSLLASNYRKRGFACYQHRIYGVEQDGSELNELDPSNGAVLSTVSLSLPDHTIDNALGLTVNPVTGVFYILLRLDGDNTRTLGTVNINTGEVSIVGTLDNGDGILISSIAFHPADPTC
jgi:hypothetical protein